MRDDLLKKQSVRLEKGIFAWFKKNSKAVFILNTQSRARIYKQQDFCFARDWMTDVNSNPPYFLMGINQIVSFC